MKEYTTFEFLYGWQCFLELIFWVESPWILYIIRTQIQVLCQKQVIIIVFIWNGWIIHTYIFNLLFHDLKYFGISLSIYNSLHIWFAAQNQEAHKKMKSNNDVVPTEENQSGSLDFVLKLDKPEIYFIEDQMNKLTNSLILDVSSNFN